MEDREERPQGEEYGNCLGLQGAGISISPQPRDQCEVAKGVPGQFFLLYVSLLRGVKFAPDTS